MAACGFVPWLLMVVGFGLLSGVSVFSYFFIGLTKFGPSKYGPPRTNFVVRLYIGHG